MALSIKEKVEISKKIQIPKNELRCESYWENDKPIFIVTSDKIRDQYFLYKIDDDLNIKKIETKDKPTAFKKYIKRNIYEDDENDE